MIFKQTIVVVILLLSLAAHKVFTQDSTNDYLKWSNRLIEAGKLDSAETVLRKATRIYQAAPEIYFTLGKVYFTKGKFRLIPFEKLLELFNVDNYSSAIKNFQKALQLKPDYWEAKYYLGRTYLAQHTATSLADAEKVFIEIIDHDQNYQDVSFQLADVYRHQNEFGKAIYWLQQLVAGNPDDGRYYIKLAEIYFEKGEHRQACYFYHSGIGKLTDEDMLEALYDEIHQLMTDEERTEYEQAPSTKKGFVLKKFWTIRDPSTGTVENERLIEHYQRIQFARENFYITVPPYYDDRGRIYIKFGAPDMRFTAAISEVAFRGNESWSYESIHKGLVFDFVERGGIFHLVQDLREAAGPQSDESHRYFVATQLYAQRSHVSDTYNRLGSHYAAALTTASQSGFEFGVDDIQEFNVRLNEYITRRNEAIIETPPEVYRLPVEKKPLSIVYRMAQFRGDYGQSQLDIYFGVPGQVLSFEQSEADKYYASLAYAIVAYDSMLDEVVNVRDQIKFESKNNSPKTFKNFVFRQAANLTPGEHWINFVIEEPGSKSKAYLKENLRINDFSGPNLKLSNIQLSFQIGKATSTSPPNYVKGDLSIVPYPFFSVHRNQPLFIYYEIYNLKFDEQGEVKYDIEYRLETFKPKENFWTNVGKIFGTASTQAISMSESRQDDSNSVHEYIAFDLSELSYGLTRLIVSIEDKTSAEKASSLVEFDLVK